MRLGTIGAGVFGGLGLCALLAVPALDGVLGLADARQARANIRARIDAPVAKQLPVVAPGLAVKGGSAQAAADALTARVRQLAADGGVLVETARRSEPGSGLAGVRVRLSGSGRAVVALADALERDAPLARFHDWRVIALADGKLRLEGELVAAWR